MSGKMNEVVRLPVKVIKIQKASPFEIYSLFAKLFPGKSGAGIKKKKLEGVHPLSRRRERLKLTYKYRDK